MLTVCVNLFQDKTWHSLSPSGGAQREEEDQRARTDQSFLVPVREIQENDYDLSMNRYKEIVYEEIEYDPPAKIIADIKALDLERAEALLMLEKLIL